MKRKTLLMAALMGGCSLQGMAQQITPRDVAGDKEYNRVCREYELKGGGQHGAVTGLSGQIS